MPRKHRAPPTWLALLQYYAVRFTAAALEAMPIPLARGTARAIARLVAAIDTKHRRIAVRTHCAVAENRSSARCSPDAFRQHRVALCQHFLTNGQLPRATVRRRHIVG